jgi:hypothetical protein
MSSRAEIVAGFLVFFVGAIAIFAGHSLGSTIAGGLCLVGGAGLVVWGNLRRARGDHDEDSLGPPSPL